MSRCRRRTVIRKLKRSLCLSLCVCLCVCLYTCIHAYTHTHTHTHTHTRRCQRQSETCRPFSKNWRYKRVCVDECGCWGQACVFARIRTRPCLHVSVCVCVSDCVRASRACPFPCPCPCLCVSEGRPCLVCLRRHLKQCIFMRLIAFVS
jgi:hypothetical protein